MNVLIVDDSTPLRKRLVQMVLDINSVSTVGDARNADEALAAIPTLDPDLVILDIQLPSGSGIDVLRTIKQTRPATKVIMLTNYPYPQYQEKCRELGADYFFSKSFNSNNLIALVERLARTKGNSDE